MVVMDRKELSNLCVIHDMIDNDRGYQSGPGLEIWEYPSF